MNSPTNGNTILQTDKATIRFGGLVAVNELTMNVQKGEIYGLIGPNGAGKTTIFNLLTGVYEPTSGDINILGKRINGLRPYQISRIGVSRTWFGDGLAHPAHHQWIDRSAGRNSKLGG